MYIIYHFMAKRWEYNGNSDRLYYSLHTAHTVLPPPSPCPKVYSLCLCLHYCPENRFISIIFLDSTYMHSVSSVTQLSPTLCDSMGCGTPGFPVHHQLQSLLKLMSIELVMPSNHLILCRPLLLPSIFPRIRIFSSESVLLIRWPKYWSFSLSISPSNEYSGLISFRMDWLDLLAVQGTLKSLLQHHSSKASIPWCSAFFMVQLSHPYMTTGKTIALTRQTFVGKGTLRYVK